VQRKIEKARNWLEIALTLNDSEKRIQGEKNGDVWANLYKLEEDEGNSVA